MYGVRGGPCMRVEHAADVWTSRLGVCLLPHLLRQGYVVHGIIRRSSSFNTGRIEHLYKDRHDVSARA